MTNESRAAERDYSVDARLAQAGAITYLHIPADDVRQAAIFYRDVFDWSVRDLDSDRPGFDDPSGHLSGAWIRGQVAAQPGLLPYIYTDDVDETIGRIVAHGGEILIAPFAEGLLSIATCRDPAGNVLGLWHDTTRNISASPSPAATKPELDSGDR